jgi:dienelactone hydrolase
MKTMPAACCLIVAAALCLSSCSHCGCNTGICPVPQSAFHQTVMKFCDGPSKTAYPVWRTKKASGPPVLVLHELNGLGHPVLNLCLELEKNGWTAYAPALWGTYGQDKLIGSTHDLQKDRKWALHDPQSSGQVLEDVAAMTRWISRMHGGQRVIVMGNCLTGAFPLALLGQPQVRAAILCQPAMPLPNPPELSLLGGCQDAATRRSLAVPDKAVRQTVKAMKLDPSKRLIGFHYLEDWIAPLEKFDFIHEQLAAHGLAERFRPIVLVPQGNQTAKEDWWQVETTAVTRNLKGPHNTVTASGSQADRKHMRQILLNWLEPMKHSQ